MTSAELRYLIAVDDLDGGEDGVRLVSIAAERGVSKVSVYRALERLEKNGYIERNDKNRVVITDFGKSQLSEYRQIIHFITSHLSEQCGISTEEAYSDALGATCAFGDKSRARIVELLKNCQNTEVEKND